MLEPQIQTQFCWRGLLIVKFFALGLATFFGEKNGFWGYYDLSGDFPFICIKGWPSTTATFNSFFGLYYIGDFTPNLSEDSSLCEYDAPDYSSLAFD